MGWLRLVGSLKGQDSCAKEPYKRDNILQKRPIIVWSLPIVASQYVYSETPLFRFYKEPSAYSEKFPEFRI